MQAECRTDLNLTRPCRCFEAHAQCDIREKSLRKKSHASSASLLHVTIHRIFRFRYRKGFKGWTRVEYDRTARSYTTLQYVGCHLQYIIQLLSLRRHLNYSTAVMRVEAVWVLSLYTQIDLHTHMTVTRAASTTIILPFFKKWRKTDFLQLPATAYIDRVHRTQG